nr:hypothetical protein [Tanacetum cinerariifolium]
MIAILEKYEHNADFHQIVDFVKASHLRYALTINPTIYISHIRQFWSTVRIETMDEGTKILATVDGKPRTISESSIRRNLKLRDEAGISSLPDAELFENLTLMGVNSPSFSGRTVPLFPIMLVTMSEGSGTPTVPHHTPFPEAPQSPPHDLSSSIHPHVSTTTILTVIPTETLHLRQYTIRARIGQSSAFPIIADEPTSPLGDDSQEMASKITAQDLEIYSLKAKIKMLEDKDGECAEPSGEDATIKGRSLETGEEAGIERSTDKGINDTEEMVNVLTSLDAASILTSGVQVSVPPTAEVTTVSIPPAGEIPTISVPTGSGMVPTASPIFTTATAATPYSRRKGKEKMVESETPKKKKLQEQMDKQQREVYMSVLRSHAGWKTKHFKVPVKEVYVEALQVKHQIIDLEIHTEGQRSYLKIIRLGGSTTSYQFFVDMLKHFDREDLNQLWVLVKETLNIRQDTSDKEKELWVELKRLYEPDVEYQLWTQTQALMHDPVKWRLYDSCGVHHVLSKDQEIFMLVEREYPLRKGLAIVMISNKLQEWIIKFRGGRFPLLKKRDAAAKEVCTANEDKGSRSSISGTTLSMQDNELEPAELKEVVEVVTIAKLMTKVVTTAAATIIAATTPITAATITAPPSAARRRKGVVQRKEKEDNVVLRYQALKRKPQTEAQAKKNMMIYLRNMAGFKIDYFKGLSYDDIHPIFEKYFNSNVAFLEKTKEQLEEEDSRALKRTSESLEEKAAKKHKCDEEKLKKKVKCPWNCSDLLQGKYAKGSRLLVEDLLLLVQVDAVERCCRLKLRLLEQSVVVG